MMLNDVINWHFDRHELAQHFLNAFETGITGALTLFAPRRYGKTEFLLLDLAPLAAQRGYNVCYCSFWQLSESPAKALRYALEESLSNRDWKSRLSSYIDSGTNVELSTTFGGNKVAIKSSGQSSPVVEDDLVAIISLIKKLAKGKKPSLLLLDEVQHLATNPDFIPLVSTLRTEFEMHRKKIYVVFTGSSRDGLMRMFRDRKAPMFHSSQQIDLPLLGSEFVSFMIDCFERASGGKRLSPSKSFRVFHEIKSVPALFHQLFRLMLINGIWDIEEGYVAMKSIVDVNQDYQAIWNGLKSVDQSVLRLLSKPELIGLYSDSSRECIAELMGVETISVASIQNAVDRLRREQIIYSGGHRSWFFEDDAFKEWVQSME